jgi:hypothetical protein
MPELLWSYCSVTILGGKILVTENSNKQLRTKENGGGGSGGGGGVISR